MFHSPNSSGPTNNPVDVLENLFENIIKMLAGSDNYRPDNIDVYINSSRQLDFETICSDFISSARKLNLFFLHKRLQLYACKPELILMEEIEELRLELQRKDELLERIGSKINMWRDILNIDQNEFSIATVLPSFFACSAYDAENQSPTPVVDNNQIQNDSADEQKLEAEKLFEENQMLAEEIAESEEATEEQKTEQLSEEVIQDWKHDSSLQEANQKTQQQSEPAQIHENEALQTHEKSPFENQQVQQHPELSEQSVQHECQQTSQLPEEDQQTLLTNQQSQTDIQKNRKQRRAFSLKQQLPFLPIRDRSGMNTAEERLIQQRETLNTRLGDFVDYYVTSYREKGWSIQTLVDKVLAEIFMPEMIFSCCIGEAEHGKMLVNSSAIYRIVVARLQTFDDNCSEKLIDELCKNWYLDILRRNGLLQNEQ